MSIQIIPVKGLPIIKEGDDLAELTVKALKESDITPAEKDVIVYSHVIVSRSEGKQVDLNTVKPSKQAKEYAEITEKDPRLIQVILEESNCVRRIGRGVLITETKHGFVCANAGVDKSNVPGTDIVAPLPDDPNTSAKRIRMKFKELSSVNVGIIICDTHGRAHRDGEINVTVGASGFNVIRDRRGELDLFGYELNVKRTAVADELASAAELVIGQSDEAVPAALIRGYDIELTDSSDASALVRLHEKDLFL